jgi:para-aminobenzoate synthetase component 1
VRGAGVRGGRGGRGGTGGLRCPAMHVDELELTLTPDEAVAAWPRLEPLALMWSGGPSWRVRNPRCRWTILARPTETRTVLASPRAAEELAALFEELDPGEGGAARAIAGSELPFAGGWLGMISYEAGKAIEAAVGGQPGVAGAGWPLAAWQRCPGAYVHDRWTGQWWVVGERGALPDLEAKRARELGGAGAFILGALRSDTGRAGYEARVARVVEYIRAGDVFQANLAHRLSGAFEGSARSMFMELCRRAQPWHGAYLELEVGEERAAVASVSPELFLEYEASTRRAVTRPMKGTRPLRAGSAGAQELARSEKDAAELSMIVDLMRNDLGRVCRYGSVRVEEGRVIESHGEGAEEGEASGGGVLQGVATISGEVREGLGLKDLVFATFPPGSVTGAPKIRAMQIIEELEVSARGPYCGAVGYISDHGRVGLNVAIRTALVRGKVGGIAADEIADGELSYSVGAGIVADSTPAEEWRETLVKAGVVTGLTSLRET